MSERPKVTSHVTQEILLRRIERAIAIMSEVDGNDAADVQGTLQLCREMLPSLQTGDPPEPGESYLCQRRDGAFLVLSRVEYYKNFVLWEQPNRVLDMGRYTDDDIVAWMPLPSPYQQPEGE